MEEQLLQITHNITKQATMKHNSTHKKAPMHMAMPFGLKMILMESREAWLTIPKCLQVENYQSLKQNA